MADVSKASSGSTSRAPSKSTRPQERPSNGPTRPVARPAEAPTRPVARPTEAPTRPVARPGDGVSLSPDAKTAEAPSERIGGLLDGLEGAFAPGSTNAQIAARAEAMVGTQFEPDKEAQCAAFVSDVVANSGANPEGFNETVRARDFAQMGATRIESMEDLQPGDILAFNNTYRFSQNEQDHTHVGVYAGDGQFIHRPTQSAGYMPGSAAGEVIKEDLQAYIERDRGRFEASFAGAYRFD